MLFYTGITRKADKILSEMKLDKEILDKNKELVEEGLIAFKYYDINLFAKLLNRYWSLKKKLNTNTTNKKIDLLYTKAKTAGALGGKIVGAGGGGFLLLIVPLDKRKEVKKALGLRELPFRLSKYGSRVIFNIE